MQRMHPAEFPASLAFHRARVRSESCRRLAERLQNEENLRKLAVQELAHRLKNKIATIQSIISYPTARATRTSGDIIARLVALSGTDDLIMACQGRGASTRDI